MRIVFAGTPSFAAQALARLIDAGHDIGLVLTQPDRPAGRGLTPQPSAVKQLASARGIAIAQPASLADSSQGQIAQTRPDAIVTAAYGLIVPPWMLNLAPHGALNVHASLLPRWRGAAPIQRALLAGDKQTGITIIRMDEGVDTGPILAQRPVMIAGDEDAGSLHDKLARLGAALIAEVLEQLAAGQTDARPQPATGITYAAKIRRSETALDWTKPARDIERAIRAFRPAPGAQAVLRGQTCKIWRAQLAEGDGDAGTVLAGADNGIRVACGEGALDIQELQRAGGRRLTADEFLRGFPLRPGERFATTG